MGSRPILNFTKKGALDSQPQVIKLTSCRWFSPGSPACSITKTGRHDITEILLKLAVRHQKSIKNQIKLKLCFSFSFHVSALQCSHVLGDCRHGWLQHGIMCYYFSEKSKDWTSASVRLTYITLNWSSVLVCLT